MHTYSRHCALFLAVLMTAAFAGDAFARGRMYNPEMGRFVILP